MRTVLVVVDAAGTPITASDGTFSCVDGEPRMVYHENLGGRFEADGRFLGTHWVSTGPDPGEDARAARIDTERADARAVAGLRALVDEMLRRPPRRS